jgi:hypothetical protein
VKGLPLFLGLSPESGKIKGGGYAGLIVLRVYLLLFYGLAFQELVGDLYIVE